MATERPAPRRVLIPPLLRSRVFRRYWQASTISMFGDQISGLALPLAAVIVLHAGAAEMGYLTALEWLPSLLFGLHAAAGVDQSTAICGADLRALEGVPDRAGAAGDYEFQH